MLKAYAGPKGGAAGYQRAVARQYANQYGVSTRRANSAVSAMANGRTAFAPSRGRTASRTGVLNQASRLAR